jgi:hypothetical protein
MSQPIRFRDRQGPEGRDSYSKGRPFTLADENADKRAAAVEHCKSALEREVIPFLSELKHHLGDDQLRQPALQLHSGTSSSLA